MDIIFPAFTVFPITAFHISGKVLKSTVHFFYILHIELWIYARLSLKYKVSKSVSDTIAPFSDF